VLEQPLQQCAEGAGAVGGLIGGLDLAENLRLAQHQRIQSRGDPQQMAHRALVGVLVQIGAQVDAVQQVIPGQPFDHLLTIAVPQVAIQLGAIAGRQDRRLVGTAAGAQIVQRREQALGGKGDPLTDTDGGSLVIQAKGQQGHDGSACGGVRNPGNFAG